MSKRVKLKDHFKVIRKVSAHNAKERRVARKAGAKKPSLLKDPGIPSSLPYREEFLKEMTFEKDRIAAKDVARKEALKLARSKKVRVPSVATASASCPKDKHVRLEQSCP